MSGAIKAVGSIQAGNAAYKSGMYNAAAEEDAAAQSVLAAGAKEGALRRNFRRTQGEQLTALAANGAVLDSGSPLDILMDSATEAELDALTARYEGQQAYRSHKAAAKLQRMGAKSARTGGYISAAAQLAGAFEKTKNGA
jgi:hypothetical protein